MSDREEERGATMREGEMRERWGREQESERGGK